MTPEEFRTVGHQLIDWIADYRANIEPLPVMSTVKPGEIREKLPTSPPEVGEGFDAILNDLNEIILPGISHWNHPRHFAYFPANASLSSVLGDLISTGLGVIGLNWQSSPALTELEELMVDWMRQMLGLSDSWQGVIQDSASTSTLVALLCAREASTHHGQTRGGLQSEACPLVVYTSTQSHSSVKKAALLAGLGLENIRAIELDAKFALRADHLAQTIKEDKAAGKIPCAIVATVGTTGTTAIDPIAEIAQIAQAHDVWLHVDTAMAGSAMILPECRWMWEGIEGADSLVLNPHKWLGAAFDCSLYYVRDPQHLIRVMSTNPSYLQTSADGQVKNYRDWGIPLGRRFRALKLWCLLREEGISGLQARLRRDLRMAQWLHEQIASTPEWEVLAPVRLQTICVRHVAPGLEGAALDEHTLDWVNRINQSGQAYLTPAKLNGRWMVRISIGAEPTTLEHVQALWRCMQELSRQEI